MHRRPLTGKPLFPGLGKAYTLGGFSVPSEWRDYGSRETLRLEASDTWQEFMRLYRTFVKEVCAPLCGAERLVFQCPPTMRIALPGCPATIQAHCDSEYPAHWHGEVNFWLPVTPVFGTNSLWLESEPEKGDFHPAELGFGEVLCFNGFQCRHYTCKNETDSTRVSFDWRAIPEELFEGRAVGMIGDYPAERI
ncbi:unnamed protein product [Prorocentrum cordatum]|uniref:Uncharacterized protein n=2 Tax=Prorocentrum cordatum TaxID=2364126 RepID=A0ABN9SID3_9DINO|nr:unnamed protein product [Polarella glacialis]